MTFACSGDGEPLYWKPLLLSTRRSPRLTSAQRVALLLFLLVSHCACGTSFLAGPERSMVTGGSSSTNSNNNNNNNKDIHNNNDNNKVHNHIHDTNGNGNNQQQRHSRLPYQQHSQQQQQQQDSDIHLQQQLQHSLQPQSHYYYHQYKQPQSQTYQQTQQTQHQPSEQNSPQQSQQQPQQKQQQSSPSQQQQQQQQQQPQSQRQKRQDNNSEVRRRLWPEDTRDTCTNSTSPQPPSPGPPAPSEEAPPQCLQIDHDFSKDICKAPTTERSKKMRNARLAFCDSYLVYNTVNKECREPAILPQPKCEHCYEKLERLDAEVSDNYAVFEDILSRYDCDTAFSTHWNCSHCKVAYKHWVCSMAFRYHTDKGVEVPPCRVYCEEVENKCPYFLPELHNQYAGEPSFLCRDSVRDRQTGVLPKPEGRCYKPCPTGNEICIQNDTETATHKDVTHSRTPNVTSGHTNDTSRDRGERSRSSSAKSLQGSVQTLWLNLAAQLGMVLWSSRTLSLYWVIGLT